MELHLEISVVKPKKLRIDLTSFCQLKCPTCPMTYKPINDKQGYVTVEQFVNLLENNPFINEIELANHGEIFLNPDLLEILKYSYEKNIKLTCDVGSNFNNVKLEVLEGLVKYQLKSMKLSIDGASQETYSQNRVGGNFEVVMKNIDILNEFKQKYNSRFPKLNWTFIIYGNNEHELPKAKKMALNKGMTFQPKLNWDSKTSPIIDKEFVKTHTGFTSFTVEEYKEKNKEHVDFIHTMCNMMWTAPQVNSDGEIFGCCRFLRMPFGKNAFRDGYLEAINSDEIQYARNMLVGLVPDSGKNQCSACFVYQDMKKTGQYISLEKVKQLIKESKSEL